MYGITGGAIGAAYLLRAAGDVGDGTLSWLSPIGWGQAMRPYAGERWWPLALSLVAGVGLVVAAVALRARRDEGAGLIAPRPGPATAKPSLTRPLGLALRLQRGVLLGWSAALFFSGRLDRPHRPRRREPASATATRSANPRLVGGRHRRPVLRGLDAHDGADRRRLRRPGGAADAQRGDERAARAAARHRALTPRLGGRLRGGRDGRLGARARRQRPRRRTRRRDQQRRREPAPAPARRRASCPRPRSGSWSRRRSCCSASSRARAPPPGACSAPARCSSSSARCSGCRTGCSTCRRSSTSRSCPPPTSAPGRCSCAQRGRPRR